MEKYWWVGGIAFVLVLAGLRFWLFYVLIWLFPILAVISYVKRHRAI